MPEETRLEIDGAQVRVQRAGRGQTLLFLHGANGASIWLPLFEKLAMTFDVIVPEHPGFGQSDDPPWVESVSDLAMFYLDFLDHLQLQDVVLVGTSLGGWIAAELAVRNTSRLSSICVVGPAGLRFKEIPLPDMSKWTPEESVRNLFADQTIADRMLSVAPTEAQLEILQKNRRTTGKLVSALREGANGLATWLHRIRVPAEIIWGKEDRLIPSAYAAAWKERISQARVEVIDGCGHLPHLERTDLVVERINNLATRARR